MEQASTDLEGEGVEGCRLKIIEYGLKLRKVRNGYVKKIQ